MNSTTMAVDVAKSVFEVAVSEHPGQVRERHRFSRERFHRYLGDKLARIAWAVWKHDTDYAVAPAA